MNDKKTLSKDGHWAALPVFFGYLCLVFYLSYVSLSDFKEGMSTLADRKTPSLTDKAASFSPVGIEDYRDCVKDGMIFEGFIKENTSIKEICVNQVYGKEHNSQLVSVDPMTSFLSLIRNKPEYKEAFIDCVSTKLSMAEDFLFNQAKSRGEKDETKKKLRLEVGQLCAKELVDKS